MKLSTRVLSITLALSISFTLLVLGLILQYVSTVSVATQYSEEIQPAREVIEHLLTTIYSDFLLVEEYLLVTDYIALTDYDGRLQHSQEQCEQLTEEVDDLITLEAITDEKAVESYETAIVVYGSWQRSRDRLLSLHKEQVVTKTAASSTIQSEKERFISLMQNATSHFSNSLEQITRQDKELQERLAQKTKLTQMLLIIILLVFIVMSFFASYLLTKKITKPLDEMSRTSISFTKGNYSARVAESSKVAELSALQKQINRVYELVDSTFKTKDEKQRASTKLLPAQYKEILDFIKDSNLKGVTITIKDVKKKFSLTHPTAISRLRYLEQNQYIGMKKEGRNKYIYEL